jgi:predicted amidohydrolase
MKSIQSLRLAAVQASPVGGDVHRNLTLTEALIARAASNGANVALFPELFLSGYALREAAKQVAELPDSPAILRICQAAAAHKIAVCIGYVERSTRGKSIYNSLAVIDSQGKRVGNYRKVHLFGAENETYARGDCYEVYVVDGIRMGVEICFDLEFPEVSRILALQGAEILIIASANFEPYLDAQRCFVKARALENQLPLALANRVGSESGFQFFGASAIVSAGGDVTEAPCHREELLLGVVTTGELAPPGDPTHYLIQRRPETYRALTEIIRSKARQGCSRSTKRRA